VRIVLVAPLGDWVRGAMPARWLARHDLNVTLLAHPSPQFRAHGAMEAVEAAADGPPATWHFYPYPHDQYLVDMLRARGHRVLVGIDDDYWHTSPWHPVGPRLKSLPQLEALLAAADGLVVTTGPIRDVVRRVNPNVAIVPNAVDLGAMPPAASPRGGRATRVGWSGWLGHHGDTALLEAPVRALLSREPALTFVVAGEKPLWADKERVTVDERLLPPLVHYRRLAELRLDAFVIPLAEHPWNEARSLLKALETAALGVPMIVSEVGPYRAVPDDAALKVANTAAAWAAALERMMEDAALRSALAARALRWVSEGHTIESVGPLWRAALT
jgi:glycosyltransferase involved in cell wall biosynthesis